jgi:hypothetical protein
MLCWAKIVEARPAVQRGRRVNRSKAADLPGRVLEATVPAISTMRSLEAFSPDGFFKELVRSGEAIPRMPERRRGRHAGGGALAQAGPRRRARLRPDRRSGEFRDAKVIRKFGKVPDDLSEL